MNLYVCIPVLLIYYSKTEKKLSQLGGSSYTDHKFVKIFDMINQNIWSHLVLVD